MNQCFVIDETSFSHVDVGSGVAQGTVLDEILFLLHINELPTTNSIFQIKLFTDDCLICREINSIEDHNTLHRVLRLVEQK